MVMPKSQFLIKKVKEFHMNLRWKKSKIWFKVFKMLQNVRLMPVSIWLKFMLHTDI